MAAAGLRADGCFLRHPAVVINIIGVFNGPEDAVPASDSLSFS